MAQSISIKAKYKALSIALADAESFFSVVGPEGLLVYRLLSVHSPVPGCLVDQIAVKTTMHQSNWCRHSASRPSVAAPVLMDFPGAQQVS